VTPSFPRTQKCSRRNTGRQQHWNVTMNDLSNICIHFKCSKCPPPAFTHFNRFEKHLTALSIGICNLWKAVPDHLQRFLDRWLLFSATAHYKDEERSSQKKEKQFTCHSVPHTPTHGQHHVHRCSSHYVRVVNISREENDNIVNSDTEATSQSANVAYCLTLICISESHYCAETFTNPRTCQMCACATFGYTTRTLVGS